MASTRGEREPSSSPKLKACQSLRWTTAPSAPRVVEMAHCPPSTRSAPKRSASRSICRMPFRRGRIAVLRADRLGEGSYRALEVEGFAAQHHEVERLGQIVLQHSWRRGQVEIADGAANSQPDASPVRPRDAAERERSSRDPPAAGVRQNSRRPRLLRQQEFSSHSNPLKFDRAPRDADYGTAETT